ncbi:importin subunit beta-3 [Leucoagaricus gongylophorus]
MSDSMLESPVDPDDTQLVCYLTSAWAKIDQAFGKELESYLTLIMPHILETANAKMDILVYADEEEGANNDRDGWKAVMVDGKNDGH